MQIQLNNLLDKNEKNTVDNFLMNTKNHATDEVGVISTKSEGLLKKVRVDDETNYVKEFKENIKSTHEVDNILGKDNENSKMAKDIMGSIEMLNNIDKLNEISSNDIEVKMEKLGLSTDEDEVDKIVPVAERIMLELAAHCENFDTTGLIIDESLAKKVSGGVGIKDAAKDYIVRNNLKATKENIYKAEYCTPKEDVNLESISDEEWNNLRGQVEKKLTDNGKETDDKTMGRCRWLIDHKLPISEENLATLEKLEFGQYEVNDVCDTDILARAKEAVLVVNETTDEEVKYIAVNNSELTLENLKIAKEQLAKEQLNNENQTANNKDRKTNISYDNKTNLDEENKARLIAMRRVVIEAQVVMTASSTYMMIKAGVSVMTTSLSEMVDKLKVDEASLCSQIIDAKNIDLQLEEKNMVVTAMGAFNMMKGTANSQIVSAYVGSVIKETRDSNMGTFTLANYEHVVASYAQSETEIRKDLGDDIKKAFDNIDDVLSDIGVTVDEAHRRAVRILSYNNIEITKSNIEDVRKIRESLDDFMDKFNPIMAAHLVKEGINPLETDIAVLNDKLDEIRVGNDIEKRAEKFSEFLYKADKKATFSKEERDSLISMYRLINWVNMDDGKVIGELYRQGRDVTLKNLLKMARINKAIGIDVRLDEAFGLTEGYGRIDDIVENITGVMKKDISSDKDIDVKKNKGLSDRIYNKISVDGTKELIDNVMTNEIMPDNTTLEVVSDIMDSHNDSDAEHNDAANNEKLWQSKEVSENEIVKLLDNDIKVSAQNVIAYQYLSANAKHIYTKLKEEGRLSRKIDVDRLTDDDSDLREVVESYIESLEGEAEDILKSDLVGTKKLEIKSEDIRKTLNAKKTLSVMNKLSSNNDFYIPATVNDEEITIHLSIKEGENTGRIDISLSTVSYGEVNAEVNVYEGEDGISLYGYVSTSEKMALEIYKGLGEYLERSLLENGIVKADITPVWSRVHRVGENLKPYKGSNSTLYKISKKIIKYITM